MIDKEIRKIGTNRDKMEKLIKHNMSVQHHKKCLLEKKQLSQVTLNNPLFSSLNDSFKNTSRLNWEIQMVWENEV